MLTVVFVVMLVFVVLLVFAVLLVFIVMLVFVMMLMPVVPLVLLVLLLTDFFPRLNGTSFGSSIIAYFFRMQGFNGLQIDK